MKYHIYHTRPQMFPIDFHCHGIGKFDFTEPAELSLSTLQHSLEIEGTRSILTLYLPKSKISELEDLVKEYVRGRNLGIYPNIVGIALEGPMLSSFGGTPEQGCWVPNKSEWSRIISLGNFGLTYIVISPDADFSTKSDDVDLGWIVSEMLNNNVLPALGHFRKNNAEHSAYSINKIMKKISLLYDGPIVTDHLFNDMPLNFKHSFRTSEEREKRSEALSNILNIEWTEDNIDDLLGPVPAEIIRWAKKGKLKVCINFDGDHVDLNVCKKAIEYIGSENIMLMTDRIQSKVLGGQTLTTHSSNTLLYQSNGIVAGGSQSIIRQIYNMMSVKIESKDILNIAFLTPNHMLEGGAL